MRYYAILNPVAGKGRLAQLEIKFKQAFDRLGIDGEIVKTISPGDAGHLARIGLKKGYSHFMCVGGDGTVFEIVNGLQDAAVTIGIIPIGEHNLFARTLGCDQFTWLNLLEQYATLPRAVAVDIGKINNYFFLTSAGFGISVNNLLNHLDRASKHIKKPSLLKSITELYKAPTLHDVMIMIEKHYTVNVKAYDVQIVNSAHFFYHQENFHISSHDRKLDLIILDDSLAPNTAKKIRQTRIISGVSSYSQIPGTHFVIQKPQHLTLQLDGELLEAETPLICTQAPFQVRFLQPQKF